MGLLNMHRYLFNYSRINLRIQTISHHNSIGDVLFSTSPSFHEKNSSQSVKKYLMKMKQFDNPDNLQNVTRSFNIRGSENVILSEAKNIEDVLNAVNVNQGCSETFDTLQKIFALNSSLN